jgi:hypothetical protein
MERQDRTLDELLEIAKRAQSIIAHLDLDAVAQHDPMEVEKLGRVADAMVALDQGEQVTYVPGVDEDQAGPPVLDPHQVRKAELLALLDAAGLSERTGRVFVSEAEPPTKPLESIPHHDGLPRFDVCVAPEYAPADGAHGIFVSDRGVFSVMVGAPVLENRWRVLRSMPYDSESEMIAIVKRYVVRPQA